MFKCSFSFCVQLTGMYVWIGLVLNSKNRGIWACFWQYICITVVWLRMNDNDEWMNEPTPRFIFLVLLLGNNKYSTAKWPVCYFSRQRQRREKRAGRLTGRCQQRPCRETWPGTQCHVSHTWTSPMERSCTGCAWAWWETDCNTKMGPMLIQSKLQKEYFSMQVHFADILQYGSTFCTQKMTNKGTRLKITPRPPMKWAHERTFIKMHSTESGFVIGPSNILFARVCVSTFQPGNFTRWGSE